jgi:hypothetical protein
MNSAVRFIVIWRGKKDDIYELIIISISNKNLFTPRPDVKRNCGVDQRHS